MKKWEIRFIIVFVISVLVSTLAGLFFAVPFWVAVNILFEIVRHWIIAEI